MKREKCYYIFVYARNKERGVLKTRIHVESDHKSKRSAVKKAREFCNSNLSFYYEGTELSFRIKTYRYIPRYFPQHRKRFSFRKRIEQIINYYELKE